MIIRPFPALAAGTVAAMLAMSASAASRNSTSDESYDTESAQVTFRNTELNSGAGAEQLYGQIRRAAQTACGDDGSYVRDLWARRDIEQCENAAIAAAVAQLNSPALHAIYDLRSPHD